MVVEVEWRGVERLVREHPKRRIAFQILVLSELTVPCVRSPLFARAEFLDGVTS